MGYFTSFEKSANEISYFFNKNHFLILLLSLVVIIFFSMYFSRQRVKHQKVAVFIIGFLLVIVEGLRLIWNYNYVNYLNEELTFLSVTKLDFFTLSLWISIPLIFYGAFSKKKAKHNIFILNFVFNVATLFAIITLIYPVNINTYFEFYHCSNIIYILLRSLIIMLGLLFAFAKWISVENFLDLWKAILSMVSLLVICFLITTLFYPETNLFYISYFPVFETLGIHLAFPYHLMLMFAFLFALQIILYVPFFIHKSYNLRHGRY